MNNSVWFIFNRESVFVLRSILQLGVMTMRWLWSTKCFMLHLYILSCLLLRCLWLSSSGISSTAGSPGRPWSISGTWSSSTWCSRHSRSSSQARWIRTCRRRPCRSYLSSTWVDRTLRYTSSCSHDENSQSVALMVSHCRVHDSRSNQETVLELKSYRK